MKAMARSPVLRLGWIEAAASFEDVAPLLAAKNVRCIGVDRVASDATSGRHPRRCRRRQNSRAALRCPPRRSKEALTLLAGGLLPEARAAIASGLRPETLALEAYLDFGGLPRRPLRARVPVEGSLDAAAAALASRRENATSTSLATAPAGVPALVCSSSCRSVMR